MTPTQQALALDALRSITRALAYQNAVRATSDEEKKIRFAAQQVWDAEDKARAAIASLEAAPAAPEFADKTITAREVARQVFALCEWFEDLQDGVQDSQEEARFKSGQRFSAKRIRNGIGTWLTDEENARKQLACAAPAAVAEPAETAAVRTLQALGYTWHGGERWKPPLGPVPARFATPPPTEPSAEPIRCAGCDIPNGCPEYCRCAPASPEPSAEVVLPEPAVWKITTKNGNVIYETATPEDVYTSQWLAICNVSPLYTAEQVRAARGVKP